MVIGTGYNANLRPAQQIDEGLHLGGVRQRVPRLGVRRLGVDVEVILTPPCMFCMENPYSYKKY